MSHISMNNIYWYLCFFLSFTFVVLVTQVARKKKLRNFQKKLF